MSEHDEQVNLFKWAAMQENVYPELKLLFAIPNGGKLPYTRNANGRVFSPQRLALVKEGLRSGVPDIFLAVSRGKFHGFFIEMKFGSNKMSDEQLSWSEALSDQNYLFSLCYSFEEAKDQILGYIKQRRLF